MPKQSKDFLQDIFKGIPEAKELDGLTDAFVRNIDNGKCSKIISHNELKKSDFETPLWIEVPIRGFPITEKCRISNLPLGIEKSQMQSYHIKYSQGDLKQMVETPKIVFDRYHKNFVHESELVSKSYFYMVAPRVQNIGLPVVYRLGVARYFDDPAHYSISMHAILGGRADGWVFLARLDNNNKNEHIVKKTIEPKLKDDANVLSFKINAPAKNLEEKPRFHVIQYPHLHRADASYKQGSQPEKFLPIHLDKCVGNNLSQNIAYMMKLFNIQSDPMFQISDTLLETIISKSKNFITDEKTPDPTEIVKSIVQMELVHQRNVGELNNNDIVKNVKNRHSNNHNNNTHHHSHQK